MKFKSIEDGRIEVVINDREHERITRLADIYNMSYEEALQTMFAFADYMATTRILNKI